MQTLIQLAHQYGLIIVFSNVLLMQLGLPIPTVPTLIVSGTLAADGHVSLAALLAVTVLASLIGDTVWYLIGQRHGLRVMTFLCRLSLSPDSCVRQTETRFERWGLTTLLVAKFIPGLSLIVAPMAGALRLPRTAFLLFDTAGIFLWASLAIGFGWLFHPDIELISRKLMAMGNGALVIIGAALMIYIGYKWWQRRRFQKILAIARISVNELVDLMDSGNAPVIVDIRSPSVRSLDARHIPGAKMISLNEWQALIPHVQPDSDIVVYCNCPNEASAAQMAKLLMGRGYKRARPLLGGLDAWVEAGHEIHTYPS
ncbi:DedA family protein/thiosulfate sulfurtransferase GlpE [Undibacterium sp. Jales W-56]|uniref:DedA family protein/thiosulfate sulfurtransferase GlpE n=1 Tax=Undibacterium sp. Jales W-56 TaxID=2897325 RepID=UPI0021D06A79|nr:DedA family protein/thiosulfate sulfurtransferase GlpE [Undibacterium sp. Jales W-56]MCU6435758.1 DedA family protein/thiosulfate sulfurtransferase GlpE [Undibacterium sp. Jales W-56]